MIRLHIMQTYFELIKSGEKQVEGRLFDDEVNGATIGSQICFYNDAQEELSCLIESLQHYSDFETMLKTEGLSNMLPGVSELSEGIRIYESFPGYKIGVVSLGALAMRIKKV